MLAQPLQRPVALKDLPQLMNAVIPSAQRAGVLPFGLRVAAIFVGGHLGFAPLPADSMISHGESIFYTDHGQIVEINARLNTIERYMHTVGAREILVDTERNLYATSMAYDAKADMFRPTVWHLKSGSSQPARVEAGGEFSFSDVADSMGRLYFWQNDEKRGFSRILYREKNGPLLLLAGHKSGHADGRGAQARLGRIGAMAIGPDDTLYVTDDESVRRITRDGAVTTIARAGLLSLGAGRTPANHLAAIAVDRAGSIFVADRATHRIFAVEPSGSVITLSDNAEGWEPRSLAWNNGSLFVLEGKDKATRAIRLDTEGTRHPLGPDSAKPRAKPIWLGELPSPGRFPFLARTS